MDNIKHNCSNCAERHNMCKYDFIDNCPYFVLGKCFTCSLKDEKTLCMAEDMSGYGCPNYKE